MSPELLKKYLKLDSNPLFSALLKIPGGSPHVILGLLFFKTRILQLRRKQTTTCDCRGRYASDDLARQ